MPAHAIDPFKHPLLDDDDCEGKGKSEFEQRQKTKTKRNSTGAKGRTSRRRAANSATGLRAFVHHLLPDTRSQIAFAVAFLAALGVSLYWLIYTIQSKWLYGLSHPQQIVSYEKVKSFPALFGIAFTYMSQTIPKESVYFRTVETQFKNTVGSVVNTYPNQYINCTEMNFFYEIALCQPTDVHGRPLIRPDLAPAGEMDGAWALRGEVDLSPEAWPLQFYGQTDVLCLTAHTLVNATAMRLGQQFASTPVLGLVPLSVQSTLAVQQVSFSGHGDSQDDPVLLALADVLPTPLMFTYDVQHLVQFKAVMGVQVDGTQQLEYLYDTGRDVPIQPEALESGWAALLDTMAADGAKAEEAARLARIKALPDSRYMQNSFCFVPSSMTLQVIREVSPYGIVTFLSDLGGFLNLLTVALLFLFPLAFKAAEPRTFILLLIADRWRARKAQAQQRRQQEEQHHEQLDESEVEHEEERTHRRKATVQASDRAPDYERRDGPVAANGVQSHPAYPAATSIGMTPLHSSPLAQAVAFAAGTGASAGAAVDAGDADLLADATSAADSQQL